MRDENRPRLLRFGADVVVRPLRGYPEMIVRGLAAPDTEKILEDLFTSRGEEVWRYAVRVSGWTWSDVVAALLREGVGLPIAYRGHDAEVVVNPPAETQVEAGALFVMVHHGDERSDDEVAALLERPDAARR